MSLKRLRQLNGVFAYKLVDAGSTKTLISWKAVLKLTLSGSRCSISIAKDRVQVGKTEKSLKQFDGKGIAG